MCGYCVHASLTLQLVTARVKHHMPAAQLSHLHSHMHTADLMTMDVYLRPDYGSNFCKWLRKVWLELAGDAAGCDGMAPARDAPECK